jgi:putative hydrolase of the HAD superfamily
VRPGFLFDLDGTLVDHRGAVERALEQWVTRLDPGRAPDMGLLTAEWSRLEARYFRAYLHGDLTFDEQRRCRVSDLLAFLGLPVPEQEAVDDLFRAYLSLYEGAWVAFDDAPPALDVLAASGLALGVLTNGDEAQQRSKLRAVGLLDRFECVVASSSLPEPKPAAGAFLAACERLGGVPGSVAYVGDDLHTDALAARQAGLRGIWLRRPTTPDVTEGEGGQRAGAEPDAVISTLLEVPDVLRP